MKKLLFIILLFPLIGFSQTQTGTSVNYLLSKQYVNSPIYKINGTSIDTSTSTIRWFTKHKMDMLTTAYNKPSSQWTNSTYPTIYYSYNTGIGAAPTAYNMFYIYDYEEYMDTHDYIGLKITGNYGRYVEDAYDCGNYYGVYISANHTVPMNGPMINYGMYCNVSGGNTNYSAILMGGNVGIGTNSPKSTLHVNGGVQIGNDSDSATSDKVGTIRYRTSGNNSYCEMCMQTGASTYAWVAIKTNSW